MKTRKNIKTHKNKKRKTSKQYPSKNRNNSKKNKNKKNNKKNNKKTKLHRGGNTQELNYLFFDKDNPPDANLDVMFRNTEEKPYITPDDIRRELNQDIKYNRGSESSILYLTNNTMDKILGYITGHVSETDGEISFVEFDASIRGRGLCTPYLNLYIKRVLETHPNINTYHLFNAGGQPSCRCYIKAFEQNNFILRDYIDCKDAKDTDNVSMFFDRYNRENYHEHEDEHEDEE